MAAPPDHKNSWLAPIALAIAGCFWGTGFFFGKIALEELDVTENVTLRFLCASILLLPVLVRNWKRPTLRHMGMLVASSLISVPIQFLLQFRGLQLTTVSHASLIVGTLPILLALTSALILHERLTGLEWIVLMISAAGAVLIAWPSHAHGTGPQSTLLGDTLVFVSLVTALVMILVTKHLMSTYGALYLTSFLLILGTVALIIYAEIFHPIGWHHSTRTWTAVAAQGVLATAGAYFLWNWGLQHTSASRAGVFLNLEPVMGTLLGVGVLHETLGLNTILGGLLILASAGYFSMKSGT